MENREFHWWRYIKSKIPTLKQAGFTALWLPPASKEANIGGPSMGYDPYDYYDLGDIDQKGSINTWFGSKDELIDLIGAAHENGMSVYADVVFNHNSGSDLQEINPLDGSNRWTEFTPGSGKFSRGLPLRILIVFINIFLFLRCQYDRIGSHRSKHYVSISLPQTASSLRTQAVRCPKAAEGSAKTEHHQTKTRSD